MKRLRPKWSSPRTVSQHGSLAAEEMNDPSWNRVQIGQSRAKWRRSCVWARNLSDLFTLCSGFQRCVASQQESPGPIHSSSAQTGKSLIFGRRRRPVTDRSILLSTCLPLFLRPRQLLGFSAVNYSLAPLFEQERRREIVPRRRMACCWQNEWNVSSHFQKFRILRRKFF